MGLHALGGLLHQTLSSEATCCPVLIGPSWGVCPGVGASWGRDTSPFALSGYCRANVGVMFSKHRVTLVRWVIGPLEPHVLRAPP